MAIKTIALVGHCGFDESSLKRHLQPICDSRGVAIESVYATPQLEELANPTTLLLINRVLASGFEYDNGLDMIAVLSQQPNPPACMLISNYADAQASAEAAGAWPGFGKQALGTDAMREAILHVMDAVGSSA